MAPPSSAHVQLDDVPRTPIQPSFEGEFRQHDGLVTMMMFYRRRALPKHRYDIIEVDYGGGGHRTRLRDPKDQLSLCLEVPPAPVYKGARGERRPAKEGTPGGSPTPGRSRTPPGAPLLPWPAASPLLLYIRGQGAPLYTQLINDLLAVCGAPLHHITPR